MKARWLITLVVAAAVIGAAVWWLRRPEPPRYVTTAVTKGDVSRYIVATGNVNPVVTVQVGTYVSGPIKSIYCDYNTKVKAGQLCAKIDPKSFKVALDQAKASLASAKAQLAKDRASLAYAKINYERDRGLLKRGIVSQDTVDSDKSAYEQSAAQVKLDQATILQRQAALEGAQVNLHYTDIVSPVDGTVVSRNVNVGQTVAASFQTPTLFLIAQDLTKMQVDTNVSESDIGAVHVGQKASFTVDAYPDKTFWGTVSQVRRAPITVQNVVTYDAVISVRNADLLLFPGMTATARIITRQRDDVLKVPLPALRFAPNGIAANPAARGKSHVWVLRAGQAVRLPVKVGIKGARAAEITGSALKAGDRVITGEIRNGGGRGSGRSSRSPFHIR